MLEVRIVKNLGNYFDSLEFFLFFYDLFYFKVFLMIEVNVGKV